jgi:hypothetical protein
MRGWRLIAWAALVVHAENSITAPEILDGHCDMSPYPFNPAVEQYAIACDWHARMVHLHVMADTYVEVFDAKGNIKGEGDAGQVVESRVLIFSGMLNSVTVNAFGGEYKVLFKLRRPPGEQVTSRNMVWMDALGARHQVVGRALQDINAGLLPATGPVQIVGQPAGNQEACAFESGLQMQGDAHSREYWIHVDCKQGYVEQGTFVLSGKGFEADDLHCSTVAQCSDPKMKHNQTYERINLLMKKTSVKAFKFTAFAGPEKGKWDMYQCPMITSTCKVGDTGQTLNIQMSGKDDATVDAIMERSPVVPHCIDPSLLKIELPMSYDGAGTEIPDQKCHGRGGGKNFMFFCPPTVDSVQVRAFLADPSAVLMAWNQQQQKASLYRDGTVSYSFNAPVGTMGCSQVHCERGPFTLDVICNGLGDSYQITIANPAGVHATGINWNPFGNLDDTDCVLEPPWKKHVMDYTLKCKTTPMIPLVMPKPAEVDNQVVQVRYHSHARGDVEFQSSDEIVVKEIHARPAETFDVQIMMVAPSHGPTYNFKVTRTGSINLMFEPFPIKQITTPDADENVCKFTPEWAPHHHDYEVNCTQGIKVLPLNLPKPDTKEAKGQVVQVWYKNKIDGDEDWLSSDEDCAGHECPTGIPMKLGEMIELHIAVEKPIEGPVYHFKIHRSGGLLGADLTEKIANFFQLAAPILAGMSGANFVTVIKFIQFMGIFNDMEGVPEAYGDFVEKFKALNFNFDPTKLINPDTIKDYAMKQIAPSMGIPVEDLTNMDEFKKKYGNVYRDMERKVTEFKKMLQNDAQTCTKVFGVPLVALFIVLYYSAYDYIIYRFYPATRADGQVVVRQLEKWPALLLILDLGLVGFCLTACEMIFEGGELDVFTLWTPKGAELRDFMWGLVVLYPVGFICVSLYLSYWMKNNLEWNDELNMYTDRECVEIHAAEPAPIPVVEGVPVVGGLVKKYWPSQLKLERKIQSVAPILRAPAEEGGEAEPFLIKVDHEKRAEEERKMREALAGQACAPCQPKEEEKKEEEKPPEDEGPKYARVVLNSEAFRGEKSVVVHEELGKQIPKALLDLKQINTNNTPRGEEGGDAARAALTSAADVKPTDDESQPLLKGLAPSGFVYRWSNVYYDYPNAKVGRLNMRVPTIRSRVVPSEQELIDKGEMGSETYKAMNEMNAEVTCRDIPGLNFYVPNTVLQVPQQNLAYKHAGMYSHILKGQGKGRFTFVVARTLTIVSIFGSAIAGQAKAAGKDAAKAAAAQGEAAMEAEAEAEAEGASKGIIAFLLPTPGLMQAAVLMATTGLSFFQGCKGEWDELDEGSFGANICAFIPVFFAGELVILWSQIVLLLSLVFSTKDFPYNGKNFIFDMTKEDFSSLWLIFLSAWAIFVINLGFFYKMAKKIYKTVVEFREKIPQYKDQAYQQYESIKLKVLFCYDFGWVCCYGNKQEKKDKREQIVALIKAQLGEFLPLDRMQQLREDYCCQPCQYSEDGTTLCSWC